MCEEHLYVVFGELKTCASFLPVYFICETGISGVIGVNTLGWLQLHLFLYNEFCLINAIGSIQLYFWLHVRKIISSIKTTM